MANVLDLTALPAKVTIENISKDVVTICEEITSDATVVKHEEGSTIPGAQDAQEANHKYVDKARVVELQMFGKNLFVEIKPNDSIVIKVETSKELLYWNLIKEKYADIFKVTIEAA